MIKHTQTKFGLKDKEGNWIQRGNCLQYTYASLLDLNPLDVPNFEVFYGLEDKEGNDLYEYVEHCWLKSMGYEIDRFSPVMMFHMTKEEYREKTGDKRTDKELNAQMHFYKDVCYLVSGKSERGFQHICIYANGKLAHDVYPSRAGLITEDSFELLFRKTKIID